jgi:hypothetical protein
MHPCSKDEFNEDGGGDFGERMLGTCSGSAGPVGAPSLLLGDLTRHIRFFDDVRWCEARAVGPVHGHHFISIVGIASVAKMVASDI